MNAYFEDDKKQDFWIDETNTFSIGRYPNSNIFLENKIVSNKHILIITHPDVPQAEKYELIVEGTNPVTFINECKKPVPQGYRKILQEEDIITIKHKDEQIYRLTFRIEDSIQTIEYTPNKQEKKQKPKVQTKTYTAEPTVSIIMGEDPILVEDQDYENPSQKLRSDEFFKRPFQDTTIHQQSDAIHPKIDLAIERTLPDQNQILKTQIDYNKIDDAYIISLKNREIHSISNFSEEQFIIQNYNKKFYLTTQNQILINNCNSKIKNSLKNNDIIATEEQKYLFVSQNENKLQVGSHDSNILSVYTEKIYFKFQPKKDEIFFYDYNNHFSFFVCKIIPSSSFKRTKEIFEQLISNTKNIRELLPNLDNQISKYNSTELNPVVVFGCYLTIVKDEIQFSNFATSKPIKISTANYPLLEELKTSKIHPPIGYAFQNKKNVFLESFFISDKETILFQPFDIILSR